MKLKRACLLLCLFAPGCASGPALVGSQQVQVVPAASLPAPTMSDLQLPSQPYAIGPLDRLRIDVYGIQELTGRVVQVDSSGNISFPMAGVIAASGKTPGQVETEIAQALRAAHIRNPQVSVNVEQAQPRNFTVYGEVREPGSYPVTGRMTLMRAVASARGFTEFSRQSEVIVFRRVGDQNFATVYSLPAIRAGAYADPEIFPNDIVAVGDSPARRMFRDVIQASSLITTPLILLLQNSGN